MMLTALLMLTVAGCGSKSGDVDTEKPVSEVKAEANTMTVDQLKATAIKYRDAIKAKEPEIQKLMDQIKEIPLTEALGEEAKKLKADLEELKTSLDTLKEHFQVYYDKLVELKADVTGLTL